MWKVQDDMMQEYGIRIRMMENLIETMGPRANSKSLVNKPESYSARSAQSLDSFIGHMDLYISQTLEDFKLHVASSFLNGPAYERYKVISQDSSSTSWEQLKQKLYQCFQPMNKVKLARDKLANFKQHSSVGQFNEKFQRIMLDIPLILQDEVIDRYRRGLKRQIAKDLCTRVYNDLNSLMADASSIEASQKSLFKQFYE